MILVYLAYLSVWTSALAHGSYNLALQIFLNVKIENWFGSIDQTPTTTPPSKVVQGSYLTMRSQVKNMKPTIFGDLELLTVKPMQFVFNKKYSDHHDLFSVKCGN